MTDRLARQDRLPRRRASHRPQALLALPQRLPGPLRPRLVVTRTCGYLSPDIALFAEAVNGMIYLVGFCNAFAGSLS